MNRSEFSTEALSALETLLSSRLHVADWFRSAELAREEIEDAPLERKFEVFDRARRAWALSLDSWISFAFSEFFDLARLQGDSSAGAQVDWAEQKVREYIQTRFHEMNVTNDYDQAVFRLETARPTSTLEFWVQYSCSGSSNLVIPESQQHAPGWLVAEVPYSAQLDSDKTARVFLELKHWFLKEIENSIVNGRLAAIVAAAKAGGLDSSTQVYSHEPDYLFKQDADGWKIRFAGVPVPVPDLRGIHYIAYLLQNPDREIHVEALNALGRVPVVAVPHVVPGPLDRIARAAVQNAGRRGGTAEKSLEDYGLSVQLGVGSEDTMLDRKAMEQYRETVRNLQAEMDDTVDDERRAKLREQIETIQEHLETSTWKGKLKKAGSDKTRIAVKKAIDKALTAVGKRSPTLKEYLKPRIITGASCRYCSDKVKWSFQ